jgi:PAS domain S-box-containing protein
MPDVKYRVDAGRSKQSVEQTNRLLQAVSEIQLKFIRERSAHSWFEQTLQAFLDVTGSEYGFIGTVHHDDDDLPWLQMRAINNIAWDQASRELYESSLPEELQLRNLKTLFGQTLRTGELFVSNSPDEDALRGGLPSGHPVLTALMAIPLKVDDHLIGVVGIANRPNGYEQDLASWLEPLCTTCATLMIASKSQETRQLAEAHAADRRQQLQTILDAVNARILYLDVEGRIVRHNLHSQNVTGLSAEDFIGKTVEEVGLRLDNARLRHQQSLNVIRSGKPKLGRLMSHTSEGKTYWSSVDKIPTFGENGNVDGLLVFVYDITDLHSTTESLQQTESQLSLLLEKMPALLWSVDQNHVFTLAVGKTLEQLGKQPGETVGSTLREYFGTDDPSFPPIARHLSALSGESVQYESAWHERSFECRLEPVRNDKGEVTGCLGVALDVTDRALSELERRKTEEQWRAVVENVPDFILVVGSEGQIRFLNHFLDGHDRRDVLQATVFDYQPVESHDKIRDALRRVFETGESVSYETIGRGKPDEWRTYVCRVVPMNVSETEPAALMIATDVTEERTAREAEARHFGILKAITEGTSELIFAKDLDSRPVFVNEAIAKMYGTTVEQIVGKPEDEFFSDQALKQIIADDQRIIRTGQTETFEEELPASSGTRLFLTTKSPWRDSSGEIVGVIGVSRDITEWKKTQNALHESRERLRAIIDNTPGCVKLVAPDGTLLEMNAAGLRMCEAESGESILGLSVFDLISDEHRSAFVRFHERVCNGIPGSIQFEIVAMQGTRR